MIGASGSSSPPDTVPRVNASAMVPMVARVLRYRRETFDIFTLTIELPTGHGFAPGQFHMLYAFGVGEIPISVSGGSADRRELIATIVPSVPSQPLWVSCGPAESSVCAAHSAARGR